MDRKYFFGDGFFHGDLHSGNIILSNEEKKMIIMLEFDAKDDFKKTFYNFLRDNGVEVDKSKSKTLNKLISVIVDAHGEPADKLIKIL